MSGPHDRRSEAPAGTAAPRSRPASAGGPGRRRRPSAGSSVGSAPSARRRRFWDIPLAAGGLILLAALSIWFGPLGGRLPAGAAPTPAAQPSPSPSTVASTAASAAPLEFEPIDLAGQGSRRVAFDIPSESAAIARIANTGSGTFQVRSLGAGDTPGDLLVDTAGDYSGTVLFDALAGQHTTAFQVISGGDWTIRIEPVGLAEIWSAEVPLAGSGDDVALLDAPAAAGSIVGIQHAGQGPIEVLAYTSTGELDQLVDTSGPLDEVHDVPPGTVCLQVRAVGSWTLSPG
jgi:hypothetical protein